MGDGNQTVDRDLAEAAGRSDHVAGRHVSGKAQPHAVGAAHAERIPPSFGLHGELFPVRVDEGDLVRRRLSRGTHRDQETVGVVAAGHDRCLTFQCQQAVPGPQRAHRLENAAALAFLGGDRGDVDVT